MIKAINWNSIQDEIDVEVWNRLTTNFWLPEKIPLSNDVKSWNTLSEAEQELTMQVFAGLTLLDTLQSSAGAPTMMSLATTPHEEAVYSNMTFMEAVHAKSYSSIFSTLASTEQINRAFDWAHTNELLQEKAELIKRAYRSASATENAKYNAAFAMAASVLLESFLFYSGFYLPFYYSSRAKLTNTADIIRLILRDEAIHGYYIGYKFQQRLWDMDDALQEQLSAHVTDFAKRLLDIELRYAEMLYDEVGWTEGVKRYLRYNLNRAFQNLGMEELFSGSNCAVEPSILSQMSADANETHDFFSGSGSSYVIGEVEETTDDDWG